jgi:hypothetical protein
MRAHHVKHGASDGTLGGLNHTKEVTIKTLEFQS